MSFYNSDRLGVKANLPRLQEVVFLCPLNFELNKLYIKAAKLISYGNFSPKISVAVNTWIFYLLQFPDGRGYPVGRSTSCGPKPKRSYGVHK